MTETLSIPLNKLVPWDGNVRKTGVSEGIEELCASIAAHGLLQGNHPVGTACQISA